jgi:hypothetical protein
MQHEVGTHVLTHHNGLAQPLTQLASGLAGYEELQEGIAVLAEYLAGGLSARGCGRWPRASLAVQLPDVEGAEFPEAFRELTRRHGFASARLHLLHARAPQRRAHQGRRLPPRPRELLALPARAAASWSRSSPARSRWHTFR